ncbi:MAG: NADH-quinone oxidoreductase subunit NuoK [Actinobacteria bacterium]|nr:NADH-quinone oxidoreductase subunit NuoK [Actinomycetota bacterium]
MDRPALPHRPPARVRDHVHRPAHRRRRRRHPRLAHAEGGVVQGPGIAWYLGIAAFLFGTGALGVLIRRNPIIVLLSLELMLNGGNLALIAFARHSGTGAGQIFALTVMAIAASEVCVGLGLVVAIHRKRLTLDVDKLSELRG